ncbi:hypothetical protein SELMODRAFT_408476 [Selaginella moellendorffii]|uniref:Uncharacterized protein n=1 Tax=Selaginella moellendorffii TaxID=88036 RepID=D8R8F4_SELML|nr:hypothetical protein SELMODRAFT_408476 [Selaginella moellendorffii]
MSKVRKFDDKFYDIELLPKVGLCLTDRHSYHVKREKMDRVWDMAQVDQETERLCARDKDLTGYKVAWLWLNTFATLKDRFTVEFSRATTIPMGKWEKLLRAKYKAFCAVSSTLKKAFDVEDKNYNKMLNQKLQKVTGSDLTTKAEVRIFVGNLERDEDKLLRNAKLSKEKSWDLYSIESSLKAGELQYSKATPVTALINGVLSTTTTTCLVEYGKYNFCKEHILDRRSTILTPCKCVYRPFCFVAAFGKGNIFFIVFFTLLHLVCGVLTLSSYLIRVLTISSYLIEAISANPLC